MAHHTHHNCPHNHFDFSSISDHRLKRLATYSSIGIALILIISKVFAWQVTESVSLLSSLGDSGLDALASLVTFISVRQAMRPADKEHRFGHGKIEALSAIAQSLFIIASALFILYEAQEHFSSPQPIQTPMVGILVMIFSIILTAGLVWFQAKVIQKTKSVAILADSMHYKADLYLNVGVLISIIVSTTWDFYLIDPIVGAAISLYILYTAVQIMRNALHVLMDRALGDEDLERISTILASHPQVHSFHDLKTRSSGTGEFIQLHVELDGTLPLNSTHKIVEEIEARLLEIYPNAEVIIHQEPIRVGVQKSSFHT